jgi:hypothetical protein
MGRGQKEPDAFTSVLGRRRGLSEVQEAEIRLDPGSLVRSVLWARQGRLPEALTIIAAAGAHGMSGEGMDEACAGVAQELVACTSGFLDTLISALSAGGTGERRLRLKSVLRERMAGALCEAPLSSCPPEGWREWAEALWDERLPQELGALLAQEPDDSVAALFKARLETMAVPGGLDWAGVVRATLDQPFPLIGHETELLVGISRQHMAQQAFKSVAPAVVHVLNREHDEWRKSDLRTRFPQRYDGRELGVETLW